MTEKHRQLIERKLAKLREARILATDASVQFKLEQEIAELEAQLANNDSAKSPQTSTKQSRKTIKNSKNIINDSAIRAGRDVHIGDKITNVLPHKEAQITNSPSNWKKWLTIIVAATAFLASVAECTGYSLHDIFVEKKGVQNKGLLKGTVRDLDNDTFLENAKIRVGTDTILFTDSKGIFKAYLPTNMQKETYQLNVSKAGYEGKDLNYSPFSTDADVRLERKD